MSWIIKQKEENYALQGIIEVSLNQYNRTVASYLVIVGRKYYLLHVLNHLIKNLDNPKYVEIIFKPEVKDTNKDDDEKNAIPNVFVELSVHREDLQLVETDNPIRINCYTNAFPNNKEAFIDFFKDLYDVMKN